MHRALPSFALAAFVALLLVAPAAAGHPSDHEESLRSLLSIKIDKKKVDEVHMSVEAIRISTRTNRTLLSWRLGDDVYVYSVDGADHETRALALARLMMSDPLVSAVVDVDAFKSERFARFYRVHALQWQIRPRGALKRG